MSWDKGVIFLGENQWGRFISKCRRSLYRYKLQAPFIKVHITQIKAFLSNTKVL